MPKMLALKKIRKIVSKIFSLPFLLLLKLYKLLISPFMQNSCRFEPSCSEYSYQAIKKHGVIKGGILTFSRLLRCNPMGGSGYDPVPEKFTLKKHTKKKNV